MIDSCKRHVPVVLLSCLIGACSSSGTDALPDTTGDTAMTDGPITDAGTVNAGETGSTPAAVNIAGAAPVAIMQGNWETDCLYAESASQGAVLFRKITLSVEGANQYGEFGWFSDPDCTVPQAVGLLLNGSSIQLSSISVPTGETVSTDLGIAVAVNFHNAEPTIDNAPVPDSFVGSAGFTDEVDYSLVLVIEDKLYFGDNDVMPENNGTSAQTRPTTIDLGFSYNRVQ